MFIQNILKFILNFENNLHSHTQRTQSDDWVSDAMVNEYSCMEFRVDSAWLKKIDRWNAYLQNSFIQSIRVMRILVRES